MTHVHCLLPLPWQDEKLGGGDDQRLDLVRKPDPYAVL
jgi:hypothetical protein